MTFRGATGEEFSLIVDADADAEVDGNAVRVTPTWAVLHRPALGDS